MDLVIAKSGREALIKMLSSCEEDADQGFLKILKSGGDNVTYGELIGVEEGSDKKPTVLKRLESFASRMLKENEVTADTVVRYFSGKPHLDSCLTLLDNFPDVYDESYILSHILLPIDSNGVYINGSIRLEFDGMDMPEKEDGFLFAHLGVPFYLDCSSESVEAVLSEQSSRENFIALVDRVKTIDVEKLLDLDEDCPI